MVDRVALEETANAIDELLVGAHQPEALWAVALATASTLCAAVESDESDAQLTAELAIEVCDIWQLEGMEAEAVMDFFELTLPQGHELDFDQAQRHLTENPALWVRMALLSAATTAVTFAAGTEMLPSHLLELLADDPAQ